MPVVENGKQYSEYRRLRVNLMALRLKSMNLILAHAMFAEKRGAEQAVNRSSSESWNATESVGNRP